jgi:hypothetical protein
MGKHRIGCDVENCNNPHLGLGFCERHYKKFKRYGNPLVGRVKIVKCTIDGCNGQGTLNRQGTYTFPKGLCENHYRKMHKMGDVYAKDRCITHHVCTVEGCNNVRKKNDGLPKGYCRKHYSRFMKYGDVNIVSQRKKEGRKNNPLYGVYKGMKQRCLSKKSRNYEGYGGRGITICDSWLGIDGFSNFIADMGERPSGKGNGNRFLYSIDRKDNNKGYSKDNCVWATSHEQTRNTRSNNKVVGVQWVQVKKRWIASLRVRGLMYKKAFIEHEDAVSYRKELENKYLKNN